MATKNCLLESDRQDRRAVQLQRLDRRSRRCRLPQQDGFGPLEVLRPDVAARIEQLDLVTGLRIDGALSSGFAQRARHTSQREIPSVGLSTGTDGLDMIDVERRFLTFLG